MREAEARFGAPVEVGSVTLTPIVEVETAATKRGEGVGLARRVTPLGVLVEDEGGTRALSLDGEELPYEEG